MTGFLVRYDCELAQFLGMPLQVPAEGAHIRILGRGALPHEQFHKQGFRRLMVACRLQWPWTTSYPIQMYSAVAGGMQRWSALLRPPLPRAMWLANLQAASMLRNKCTSLPSLPRSR